MGGDIHSIQFYKLMALNDADNFQDGNKLIGNKNGVIDTPKEVTIYNAYLERIDRDNNKEELTETDVSIYREEVSLTPEEKKFLEQQNEILNKPHLSDKELNEALELGDKIDIFRRRDITNFGMQVRDTIAYLKNMSDEQLKTLGITIEDIEAYEKTYQKEYGFYLNI